MSEKKTAAVKAAAETKTEGQETKSQAASAGTTAKTEASPVMYVGPTIAGVAIQNTVYSEMPDGAKEAAAAVPAIRNLFIPVTDYPKAQRMIREKKGYIHSAYEKALEYKGGVKK